MQKPLIFILHVLEDDTMFQQLKRHLENFVNKDIIELRHIEGVRIGTSSKNFLEESLEAADMVIPLLSANFLSDQPMMTLFELVQTKHEEQLLQLVPILLKSCLWESVVGDIQILPKGQNPINQHPYLDLVCSDVTKEILQLLHIDYDAQLNLSNIPKLFLQYSTTLSKLELLPYPFSETFILQVIPTTEWQKMQKRRDLFQTFGGDTWHIHEELRSDLQAVFQIENKQLKQFAQDCLSIYSHNLPITDRINILNVLLDYVAIFKSNRIYLSNIFEIFQEIDVLQLKQRESIKPILSKIEKQIKSKALNEQIRARAYQKLADDFVKLNYRLDKAMQFAETTLLLMKQLKGHENLEVANCMETIGIIYRRQGDFEKAIGIFQKALIFKEKKLSEYHFDLAVLYWRMANPYIQLYLLEEAEVYLGNAVEICSNQPATLKRQKFLATIYNNFIQLYQLKQDYESVKFFFEKAIALKEKLYGKDHPQTAITYTQRANFYYLNGNYDKALKDYEYVKEIQIKNEGENHPYTISAFSNLATTYKAKGMYQKANELFQQVLSYLENHAHTEAFIFYAEVGKYYLALKDYQQARKYFDISLTQIQIQFGEESKGVAHYFHDMGLVYQQQHSPLIALELFEASLILKIENLGNDNLFVAETLYKIGEIKKQLDSYEEALDFFQKTLLIRQTKKAHNEQIEEVTKQIAEIHYLLQNYSLSIIYYEEALSIYKKSLNSIGQTIIHAQLINVYIKADKIQKSKFVDYVCALLYFLQLKPSADDLEKKVIRIFNQEHTFNEELAQEILKLV